MAPWGILTFICVAFILVEARRFHQKRETKSHLCDQSYNSTNKIQCFCIKDSHNHELIRSADCFPSVDGLTPDDPIWNEFKDLENASKISFNNAGGITIKHIPKNALLHTKAVTKVEIKYGNIEIIEPFAFANSSTIRDITLTDNQIKKLKIDSFAHLKNLVKIGLDINLIEEINRDVFIDLPSLEKIYLTSNKITTIHDKAFVHLSNLRELEIDRNYLFSLNSETFSGLEKLEKLDLSGNSLEVIGDNTFTPLNHLRYLNLEGNKIQMLDDKAFNGLARLQSLSLAHNALTDVDNVKIFEGLKALILLNFRGNKFRALKAEVMAPILNNFYKNISSLNVEDNNFQCDCKLDWFSSLMNNTQSPHLKLSIENLKCTPTTELREKWIKATDVEKNSVTPSDYVEPSESENNYDYYDDSQLNGQLFYIDIRILLNCTQDTNPITEITPNTTPFTTSKPTPKGTAETTKANTDIVKVNTTTFKPLELTAATTHKITNQGVLDLSVELTTVGIETSYKKNLELDESKEKKPSLYTTSRLATVSAKPIENKDNKDFDHDMASDEAKPDQIKAHRSVQEMKDARDYTGNDAHKIGDCALMILTILCIRFF